MQSAKVKNKERMKSAEENLSWLEEGVGNSKV